MDRGLKLMRMGLIFLVFSDSNQKQMPEKQESRQIIPFPKNRNINKMKQA